MLEVILRPPFGYSDLFILITKKKKKKNFFINLKYFILKI